MHIHWSLAIEGLMHTHWSLAIEGLMHTLMMGGLWLGQCSAVWKKKHIGRRREEEDRLQAEEWSRIIR